MNQILSTVKSTSYVSSNFHWPRFGLPKIGMNLAYRKSFYVFHDEANLDQRNSTKDKALSPTLGHLAILEGFIDKLL